MSAGSYNSGFYDQRHADTRLAAEAILDAALRVLPPPKSAVDVGCGVGTWLSVLRDRGVSDILGVEGSWVQRSMLQIPPTNFLEHDLTRPLEVNRRFDLALTLEVAEHLPHASAADFVQSLVRLSDRVLFAAAIPGQGGTHHVNEQWLDYWENLFARHDYVGLDVVRRAVWNDTRIPRWYRQNTVLFVARTRLGDVDTTAVRSPFAPLPLVHPETFALLRDTPVSVARAWALLRHALRRAIARRLGRR